MEKYDFCPKALKKKGEVVIFEDTHHALRYAAEIFTNDHLIVFLTAQHHAFEKNFVKLRLERDQDLDALGYLAFQIQLQGECLKEVWKLYGNASRT